LRLKDAFNVAFVKLSKDTLAMLSAGGLPDFADFSSNSFSFLHAIDSEK